eukprot:scaffold13.g259.t1
MAGPCLYSVLGVPPTADAGAIKAAFRLRAKQLHPDARTPIADRGAFVQLLSAYQARAARNSLDSPLLVAVLIDTRSRALYDLSRQEGEPRALRRAAAAGVAAGAEEDEVDIDLSWGLAALFKHDADEQTGAGQRNKLDRLRAELQRRGGAGARRSVALEPHALPEAFEADERSERDCPDLLALVSGRQLLGTVRERRLHLLACQQAGEAALAAEARELLGASGGKATAAGAPAGAGQGQRERTAAAAGPAPDAGVPTSCSDGTSRSASLADLGSSSTAQQGQRSQEQLRWSQGQQQRWQGGGEDDDADVLEWVDADGEVLATGVRKFPRRHLGQGAQKAGQQADRPPVTQPQQHGQQQGQEPAAAISFFRREALLATLLAEHEAATSRRASAARLLAPDGRHTHTVLRSQSPLVRHLTIVAEPGACGTRRRAAVCRARRAWLPPSALWLFRPRCYAHDIGGWAVEWGGERQRAHPAWLDPAVFVLACAFDSLDYERAAQQPQGLFGRLRAGDETAGGPLRWLRAALRFHGGHSG